MIHDLDISKWPDDTFAKWSSFIYQTPALDWNWKIVDLAKVTSQNAWKIVDLAKVTFLNAKRTTSSLLCANDGRQDKL